MALRYKSGLRTQMWNNFVTTVGSLAFIQLYTGAPPANCAAAATGTLLCEIPLPATWWSIASAVLTKLGNWSGTAIAAGNVGYWRLVNNAKTTCHMQGTIAASGGDLTIDAIALTVGMPVSVTTFSITAGNP